jgi:hypothetical protein
MIPNNLMMATLYGSRLYGTSIETSDYDVRGIYVPTLSECVLNRIQDVKTENVKFDSCPLANDTQMYSIQRFLSLASQGQSVAIEMLCSTNLVALNDDYSSWWNHLRESRKFFFSKKMYAFLGYSKSMSQKYSARAERLNEVLPVLALLKAANPELTLSSVYDQLPESTNTGKSINTSSRAADNRVYNVCGRQLQVTVKISHALEVIQNIQDSYGERVKGAKEGNIDYKALSHAFRVAYQCESIVKNGDLQFPLPQADYLRDMRLGKINFVDNNLDVKLDELINSVDAALKGSDLPEEANKDFVDSYITELYRIPYYENAQRGFL